MKIAIFSDTHGRVEEMLKTIGYEKPDYVFHLGDHASDAAAIERAYPMLPVAEVRGNCDLGSDSPLKREFTLFGKRFFLTHGHRYSVKTGLSGLVVNAKCAAADIVVFGHTHIPVFESLDGITVINPGSMGFGGTYAILEISGDKTDCKLKTTTKYPKES